VRAPADERRPRAGRRARGTRTPSKQAMHDSIVRGLVDLWADPGVTVTANPGEERNLNVGTAGYPDLVAWERRNGRNMLKWVGEVETEETVNDLEARREWRAYGNAGVPFYLVVPKGYGRLAAQCAYRAGVNVARVLEYAYQRGGVELV
jgi:hypothetical protein